MEWWHSCSPHPKKFRVQTSAAKVLASIFWDQDDILLIDYLQRAKLSTQSITHLCWCNWRAFWRKNAVKRSPRESCSCTTMPLVTGHFQSRRNWPTWTSTILITHLFSRSGPVGLPPVLWTEKTIERSPFFIQRRSHSWHGDLVGRIPFWLFFEWVAQVRATG